MGKYTRLGSAELDARIDSDMQRISKVVLPLCEAGILLGGYGRGEGTPYINPDGSQSPFNDYDLVVITERINRSLCGELRKLEQQLTDELDLPVDLCPYPNSSLPRREFSLLNYEMKYGHKVIWGAPEILDALPDYPHDALPRSEGTRLLLNRGKLLLDIQQRLAKPDPLNKEERIRFIKFIYKALLAFGDCALLAADQYDIAYTVKKERILNIEDCPNRDYVIDGYAKTVELKEWGDFQSLSNFDVAEEFEKVRDVFLHFLPWYRTQYSGRECSVVKAIALNLKWNRRLSSAHPREQLYTSVMNLLQSKPDMPTERFYQLQRRFS